MKSDSSFALVCPAWTTTKWWKTTTRSAVGGVSRRKAETSYKAQPGAQCPQSNAGSEGIYPRLDWLLSSSRHETDTDVLGWMAAAQIPNVHLEVVEEAQNEDC